MSYDTAIKASLISAYVFIGLSLLSLIWVPVLVPYFITIAVIFIFLLLILMGNAI